MSLQVNVSNLGGRSCRLVAPDTWTVADVRSHMSTLEGAEQAGELRLFSDTRELAGAERLSELVRPGSASAATVNISLIRRDPQQAAWLAAVQAADGSASLADAPLEIQEDREVASEAVGRNGRELQYAGDCLRGDRDFVLSAVKVDGFALEFASEELRADREVVLAAVAHKVCEGANWNWRHNRVLVRAVVESLPLKFAAQELRADKEVVFVAVSSCGLALAHAAQDLRADRQLVLTSVKENGFALEYAAPCLCADEAIVLAAVRQNWRLLLLLPPMQHPAAPEQEHWQRNRAVILAAVQQEGTALKYAAEDLQGDFVVVLCAVLSDPSALKLAAPKLRRDLVLILVAWHTLHGRRRRRRRRQPDTSEEGTEAAQQLAALDCFVHKVREFAARAAAAATATGTSAHSPAGQQQATQLAQQVLELMEKLGQHLDVQRVPRGFLRAQPAQRV